MRAAAMHASDIPIHSSPWVHPNTNVAGCGFPSANAQINSEEYTHE